MKTIWTTIPIETKTAVFFICWLLDFFETYELEKSATDMVIVDSSPFIRPLAELKDEFENFAVVISDNTRTRIFLVTAGTSEDEERVKGNVKNHVKVGGWSQQRYERRRDKQLLHYTKEIAEKLDELNRNQEFRRIILVGSRETINEIKNNLPRHLKEQLAGEKALDIQQDDDSINQEIFKLFFEQERKSEQKLWDEIKAQYMSEGLAVVGMDAVLGAAETGRIEKVIVNRNASFTGIRCRNCEALHTEVLQQCPSCGSSSVFEVDTLNELVETLEKTSATIDFADKINELEFLFDIAGLLRY